MEHDRPARSATAEGLFGMGQAFLYAGVSGKQIRDVPDAIGRTKKKGPRNPPQPLDSELVGGTGLEPATLAL